MEIRFDYVIVVIAVLAVLILGMFLLDSIFTNSYDAKATKYNAEFETIQVEFRAKNYERVIALSEWIIDQEDLGTNEIRAKVYIGLSKLELNETADAIGILEYLINQYPGIKMVYTDWFNRGKSKADLIPLYKSILNDFVPGMEKSVTKGITLAGLYRAMDAKRWVGLISALVGSIVIYERIRQRGNRS